MHATAKINGTVVAETDTYEFVEGNIYFPPSSVKTSLFKPSDTRTHCPWKGEATYNNAEIDGKVLTDVAWHYAATSDKAQHIKDFVAFDKRQVDISKE